MPAIERWTANTSAYWYRYLKPHAHTSVIIHLNPTKPTQTQTGYNPYKV